MKTDPALKTLKKMVKDFDMKNTNGNGSFRGYSPVWPIVFVKRTPPKEKVGKIHLTDQSIAKVSHADGEIVAVPPEDTWPKNSDIFIDERLRNGKAVGKTVMYGLYTGFDFDPDSETANYGKDVVTMIRFDEIKGIREDK